MKNQTRNSCIRFCAFILVVFLYACRFETPAAAQPLKVQDEGFAVSPIPMIQPVTQEGAGLAVLYRYHLSQQNKTSSSSSTGIGGFITGNRSWGAGIAQKFYMDEDRWRARVAGTYADVRYNFYGIGTEAGEAGGDAGELP
jgi:hypothetical protein